MLLNYKIVFLLFFILSSVARSQTGNKVGNGGHVVICKDSKENTILDFYENPPKFTTTSEDPYKILALVLKNLSKHAPKLATKYEKRLASIQHEIQWVRDKKLTTIEDSFHLHLPSRDCELKQIAIRKNLTDLKNEKKFLFQEELWEILSPINQAGLILHEIVYEHFSQIGEGNSIKARKFNSFLFTEDLSSVWKLINELEIPIYP